MRLQKKKKKLEGPKIINREPHDGLENVNF